MEQQQDYEVSFSYWGNALICYLHNNKPTKPDKAYYYERLKI